MFVCCLSLTLLRPDWQKQVSDDSVFSICGQNTLWKNKKFFLFFLLHFWVIAVFFMFLQYFFVNKILYTGYLFTKVNGIILVLPVIWYTRVYLSREWLTWCTGCFNHPSQCFAIKLVLSLSDIRYSFAAMSGPLLMLL